jgi:flagellar basal-body rod protein FlgB
MFEQLTGRMEFYSNALQLRAHRQQVLASNIANADTPGYQARDFDFASALQRATGTGAGSAGGMTTAMGVTDTAHMRRIGSTGAVSDQAKLAYTVQTQPSLDGNSVDLDQQRANFTDNAVRYESTLRFINGHVKTMLSAIQGQ